MIVISVYFNEINSVFQDENLHKVKESKLQLYKTIGEELLKKNLQNKKLELSSTKASSFSNNSSLFNSNKKISRTQQKTIQQESKENSRDQNSYEESFQFRNILIKLISQLFQLNKQADNPITTIQKIKVNIKHIIKRYVIPINDSSIFCSLKWLHDNECLALLLKNTLIVTKKTENQSCIQDNQILQDSYNKKLQSHQEQISMLQSQLKFTKTLLIEYEQEKQDKEMKIFKQGLELIQLEEKNKDLKKVLLFHDQKQLLFKKLIKENDEMRLVINELINKKDKKEVDKFRYLVETLSKIILNQKLQTDEKLLTDKELLMIQYLYDIN